MRSAASGWVWVRAAAAMATDTGKFFPVSPKTTRKLWHAGCFGGFLSDTKYLSGALCL